MRAPQHRQPGDRTPLNDILGTEAAVRILRALGESGGKPVGVTALADRTELERSSARRSLATLAGTGIVEALGSGRTVLYRLRAEHPLADAITALFVSESVRAAETAAAFPFVPAPARPRAAPKPRTPDIPLPSGSAPNTSVAPRFDLQSPRLAQLLADRILHDPSLVPRALAHVVAQIAAVTTPVERFELEQWGRVLRIWPSNRIARLLSEDNARADKLRESMPFLAVMHPTELEELRHGMEKGETPG